MHYIDLIDKLSDTDKKTIENYIYKYGIKKENFIGLNEYLGSWSHAKQRLYKLLGEKIIIKVPIEYEKSERELKSEIHNMFYESEFYICLRDFIREYIDNNIKDENTKRGFHNLLNSEILVENETFSSIKLPKTAEKKTLQIPAGTKPMKAFSKIVDYFSDVYTFSGLEDLRIKHSIILTDKHIKTNLCISIHPLDFITMSDNDSKWSSCMSWKSDGCYKIGSVEMMNSNNVICCYLDSPSHSYCFGDAEEAYSTWNNKTYRILFYVTHDIIMSGKSYPYANDNIAKIALDEIKKLAEDNLHWFYQYGIERYEDMKYLYSMYSMDRAKWYIKNDPQKYNIIWDTKGMYNDMLNDHNTKYWCYRNKPNHPKMLSVSGKAPCLCCGGTIIEKDEWADDYNERYSGVSQLICGDCRREVESYCDSCNKVSFTEDYHIVRYAGTYKEYLKKENQSISLCSECDKSYLKVCPCCGRPFLPDNLGEYNDSFLIGGNLSQYKEEGKYDYKNMNISRGKYGEHDDADPSFLENLYVCGECLPKIKEKSMKIYIRKFSDTLTGYLLPINEYSDFRFKNLKPYEEITDVFY